MLTPGRVTLAELEAVWRGGPAALDPAARPAVETPATQRSPAFLLPKIPPPEAQAATGSARRC
jgi:hypothetical protein